MVSRDEARRELARRELERRRQQQGSDPRDSILGRVDSVVRGAADILSLGYADEIAAGLGTGFGSLGDYEEELARQRGIDEADAEERGAYRLAGQLAGGVGGGVGLSRSGLSLAANAVNRGATLGRVAAASAGEGAILGGLHGTGSGEGVENRLFQGGLGGVTGLALGAAAPYAVAGLQKIGSMAAAPALARFFPESYAEKAIGEGVQRSGMTVDDIVTALQRAQADDQGAFTVADAMGNSGQRMLSTVARTPNNERQAVIEALQRRQMGQGDRLSSFLADGFDAADTAAQREAALGSARTLSANANYTAAREGARPVNLNNAVDEIDRLLGRDPILGDTALSTGPLGTRLKALRDQLSREGEQLIDFDRVLNIKSDLFQQMQRNPQVANDMRSVYGLLDEALEKSSSAYRAANDTFRQQSKTIEAVDLGRRASSGRMRSADTVQQFGKLSPEEQAAFRAGYADPLIARVEAGAMSPTTNKARQLITPKTGEEFPAFASSGKADQLGDRIAREQRMFETANQALGGSRTADNLADAAEMARFDPGVMAKLMRQDYVGALLDGIRRVGGEAKGTPPRVVEEISKALMASDPAVAKGFLTAGSKKMTQQDKLRAQIVAALVNSLSAGAGRLSAP